MPWLPLAILLIVALTAAALALILFPPGEPSEDAGEDDIADGDGETTAEDEPHADAADEATEDDPTPSSVDSHPPLSEEDEGPRTESELASEPDRRGGGPSTP